MQDSVFKNIAWVGSGLNIGGEYLPHLEFTDDTIAAEHTPPGLEAILHDINETSKPVELNMHLGKTKVVFNKHVSPSPVTVDDKVEVHLFL